MSGAVNPRSRLGNREAVKPSVLQFATVPGIRSSTRVGEGSAGASISNSLLPTMWTAWRPVIPPPILAGVGG